MGNHRKYKEGSSMDRVAMMLEMKREFKNMKRKKAEEIKAVNEIMKRKFEVGHTLITQENLRKHGHSENRTLTQME